MSAVPPAKPVDTPSRGWSYRDIERGTLLGTVTVLSSLAAAAWWATVENVKEMSSMVGGLADVGRAMPFQMSAALFLGMWTTMMVAMMFPTVAPIVFLHRMVMRRRRAGRAPTVAFGSGYLAVWAALGVVPFLVLHAFRSTTEPSPSVARAAGLILVLAGAYQFSRWKETCLRACRSPMTFLATHDFSHGKLGSFRAGFSHGLYCAGCCWALMAVLFVVGLMNLVWMAAIAAVFLAEKNWKHGVALTRLVGTAVLALGVIVTIQPSLLHALSAATNSQTGM